MDYMVYVIYIATKVGQKNTKATKASRNLFWFVSSHLRLSETLRQQQLKALLPEVYVQKWPPSAVQINRCNVCKKNKQDWPVFSSSKNHIS